VIVGHLDVVGVTVLTSEADAPSIVDTGHPRIRFGFVALPYSKLTRHRHPADRLSLAS
jgi:hypothetical protein